MGAVIALLGLTVWVYYPFVPDPVILLFRQPTTGLSSNSLPGQWAMAGRNLQLTRYVADVLRQPQGRVLWSQPLGEPTRSAPTVVDGIIYIGSHFKVLALDAGTGQPVWEQETTGPVHSSLAVAGDKLYLGLLDHRLVALDRATGETRWEFKTGDTITASPVVHDGMVYFGSWDGNVYALDAATGDRVWKQRTNGQVRAAVAIRDGALFASDNEGNLHILNARTGQRWFRFRTRAATTSSPAVTNELAYFRSGGKLFAVDTGARRVPGIFQIKKVWAQLWLWQVPGISRPPGQKGGLWSFSPQDPSLGIISTPAVAPNALYAVDAQGILYGRDAFEGTELWQFQAGSVISGSPIIVGDRLYFGDKDGFLYSLDRTTGEPVWRLSLGAPVTASPVYAEGRLYVRTGDGRVHAVE